MAKSFVGLTTCLFILQSDADDADVRVKIEPGEDGAELKKSDIARGKIKEEVKHEVWESDELKEEVNTW